MDARLTVAVAIIGFGLTVALFGVGLYLVLKRPRTRGGRFKAFTVEVDVAGGGLFLMVVAVATFVLTVGLISGQLPVRESPTGLGPAPTAASQPPRLDCDMKKTLVGAGAEEDRQRDLVVGSQNTPVIDASQRLNQPIGVRLHDKAGHLLGGLVFSLDVTNGSFSIDENHVYDAHCLGHYGAWINLNSGQSRTNPRTGDTLRFDFAGTKYWLRLAFVAERGVVATFVLES